MTTSVVSTKWLQLAVYLAVTYALAVLAMSTVRITDESFGFGAYVWAVPALIAIASRNRPTLAARFRSSLITLVTLVVLVRAAMFVFEATY